MTEIPANKRGLHTKILSSGTILSMRLFTMGSKLLLSIFVARYLGLEALGLYGMIVGAAAIVPTILRFGMVNTIARDAVSDSPQQFGQKLSNYSAYLGIVFSFLVAISFLAGFVSGNPTLFLLVSLAVISEHIVQDLYNFSNNLSQPRRANIIVFVSRGLWPVAYMVLALMVVELRNLETLLAAWAISFVFALAPAASLLNSVKWPTSAPQPSSLLHWLKAQLKYARPLFFGELANNASFYVDRYLIALFLDLKTAGIYVLFWQVGSAIYNLANAGSMQIYRPQLIRAHDTGDHKVFESVYRRCVTWTLGEAALISVAAILLFPAVARYTGHDAVEQYMPLLYVMLAGVFARIISDLVGYRLYTRRRDKAMMHGYLLIFVLTTVLDLVALTFAGIYGAAFAIVATYLIVTIFRWRASR